jgi:hypothetical protein
VLTIHGDMGTWTFSRLPDMFEFFRSHDGKLRINESYWAEKLRGGVHGGRDSSRVWDEDYFAERLIGQLSDYYSLEQSDLEAVTKAAQEEVLVGENEHELMSAAAGFSHQLSDGRKFQFDTCELPDGKVYAYHFVWCLYAIVWGIRSWDERAKGPEPKPGALN